MKNLLIDYSFYEGNCIGFRHISVAVYWVEILRLVEGTVQAKNSICYPRLHSNAEKNRCPDVSGESRSTRPGSGFVPEPLIFCISLRGLPYQSVTDWVGSPVVIYFLPVVEAWKSEIKVVAALLRAGSLPGLCTW